MSSEKIKVLLCLSFMFLTSCIDIVPVPAPLSLEEQKRCQVFCLDNQSLIDVLYSYKAVLNCRCKNGTYMQ
jgi:hypothetical protein